MGSPPPPDAPSLDQQASADAEIGFEPSPSGPSICGFGFPQFVFSLSFSIPGFPPFPIPPNLSFFLGLNCDLSNPFDFEAEGFGKRVSNIDPEADPEFG